MHLSDIEEQKTNIADAAVEPKDEPAVTGGESMQALNSVARSTLLMTIGTLLSRCTGLFRTWAMAYALGTTLTASAYQIANNLPNIIYEVIAGGMIAAAFLPVLMTAKAEGGRDSVNRYSSNILNIVFVVLGIISLFGIFAAEPIVATQTFTVEGNSEVVSQAVWFFRIFSLQILFYGIGGIVQGMLNAERSFFLTAIAPALNNIIAIMAFVGYTVLLPANGVAALWVLGIGTTLGVFVQAAVLIPRAVKMGFRWTLGIDFRDPLLRQTLRISVPTIVFVIASIVGMSARNAFSLVPTDSGPAMVAYAFLWFQLPYGIVAVSLSRTMFTEMSDAAAHGDSNGLRGYIARGVEATLFLIIPMAVCLISLAEPLIGIFQAGAFGADGISQMARMLVIWSIGLPFYSVMMFFYNAYAAIKKFHVFAIMNVAMTCVQVGLYWVLTESIGLDGIPCADIAYYILYSIVAFLGIRKLVGGLGLSSLVIPTLKVLVSSGVTGAFMWALCSFMLPVPDGVLMSLAVVAVAGVIGLGVAFFGCYIMKVNAVTSLVDGIRRKLKRG